MADTLKYFFPLTGEIHNISMDDLNALRVVGAYLVPKTGGVVVGTRMNYLDYCRKRDEKLRRAKARGKTDFWTEEEKEVKYFLKSLDFDLVKVYEVYSW